MRKILITAWMIALSIIVQAQVTDAFQGILPVTDPAMMKCLNGVWSLKVTEGVGDLPSVPEKDDSWGSIPVPGCWEAYGFCQPKYDSPQPLTGYYRTTFSVPKEWRKQQVVLRFDGVLYGYDLWINGRKAGSWRSGYNTALFDITPFLNRKSDQQELALRVVSQFRGSDFDYNDDWAPNGIIRDVTLMTVPKTHLKDLTIHPKLTGEVDVVTEVENGNQHTKVVHEIFDAQGVMVGTNQVRNPHLWTAETPYLYTLRTRLVRKDRTLQTFEHRFGFRELTIDGNVLKLNGQPIKLRGVTCHATDPKTVKVIDEELTLKDMRMMKEASVNYIRTSHYPREPRFYELTDSLGFYVIDEVPFGFGDKNLYDSTFYEVLQQRAQATIRRDMNHPSVLIWSLGNENPLTDICVRLGEYVKEELDPTRPICYPQVGSYFRGFNYQFPQVADIYPTTDQIAGFYQHADRPVIFTEYCHSLGISLEDHDRQWEIIERTPCITGGSVWEWVDQGMPFREEKGMDGDQGYGYEERVFTSPNGGFEMFGNKGTDGLLYADRTPLPNYFELQHNYAQAAVIDSILPFPPAGGTQRLMLHVRNRYDFLNLKDNVTFRWFLSQDRDTIASGTFSPDCPPRQTVTYPLLLSSALDTTKICLLQLDVYDAHNRVMNHQSIPVGSASLVQRFIRSLTENTSDPMRVVQDGILLRAGRKATMAEKLKVGNQRLERYLLHLSSDSKHAGAIATEIKQNRVGNVTHYTFTLTPDTTNTFLSELGIAFLLDPAIDRVQWIGNGMMPTYPGRYRAGRYGFWSLQRGDLYFEGNRQGVDAALLTDERGDGLLIFCQRGNISFEQTDKGIVLTYNAAVSGEGPKFARTAFPVIAKEVGTVSGDFYLYRVEADKVPQLVHELFDSPSSIRPPFRPFLTQYDTYLMRYDDIVDHSE